MSGKSISCLCWQRACCGAPADTNIDGTCGSVDLKTKWNLAGRSGIGAFDDLSDAWFQRRLFRQNYVCMMRQRIRWRASRWN
jgi:hypothetical protein